MLDGHLPRSVTQYLNDVRLSYVKRLLRKRKEDSRLLRERESCVCYAR